MSRRTSSLVITAALAATALAGCTSNSPSGDASGDHAKLSVSSDARTCDVSSKEAPSGNVVFNVTNKGSQVTEFYLLGEDGLRIVGEVENIAPGLTRDLVVKAAPGKYFTACKPGMVGQGIRSAFTVTDSGADLEPSGDDKVLAQNASTGYASYVKDQTEQLLTKTGSFVSLYKAGKDDQARALYADARRHWERVEPVAESFGDLDPKMDLREADLEPKQKWTGWHRIEKDLWPPKTGYTRLTPAQRATVADQLLTDTRTLYNRTRTTTFTADQIANGSKELLGEVATGKVTGEEEIWSHTDLWDFQANVDGARVGFENLRPIVQRKDKTLDTSIATKFTALQKLLDQHKKGDGFVLYTELTPAQVKELASGVNALSEPLSKLTSTVTL
ncbi:EfeM/EfeO family lipoprotein [Luteipulveratus sp. YIM 133132]|uniref:iron uptake system protein EfeO n=1 Tax=Luteipulveratus flavus TaxID=3031728 RepID=UPI0023AF961F|nr:iron uptake system protein EfeO [Luteipulveratus sp. YIM 133132]MDE9366301.1 EfeM/EfeO family lipoprotein [Luteipulveratus sp. YIM 133132]